MSISYSILGSPAAASPITDVNPERRFLMQASLLALLPGLISSGSAVAGITTKAAAGETAAHAHDFDFFLGSWRVSHRRLRQRLVNNNEWEEFDGTTRCQSLLGGIANMNDSVVNRPGRFSRGLGLRAFDARTNTWADWYLSSSNPTEIGAPGLGRFANGVGTFFSDETFEGRPIKVRGIFSPLTADSLQWEQAFSPDEGKTWETNWVMTYVRMG